MTAPAASRRRGLLRLGLSLAVLLVTLHVAGAGALVEHLLELDPGLALVALGVCMLQFPLLAARWWLFARWLRVPLGYGQALGEYTLSTLLNQLLPLGVLGDGWRLLRHSEAVRRSGPDQPGRSRVALALVLDRASGQLALWLWLLALAPEWWRALGGTSRWPALVLVLALIAAALGVAWLVRRRWRTARSLFDDGVRALLSPRKLLLHLPIALLLVSLHVAAFALVARAFGFELPLGVALRLVPPVLVAATLPGFFAGLGAREAASAGLYAASGLLPAEGALVALSWGALGLLASTPGAWVWSRTAVARHST